MDWLDRMSHVGVGHSSHMLIMIRLRINHLANLALPHRHLTLPERQISSPKRLLNSGNLAREGIHTELILYSLLDNHLSSLVLNTKCHETYPSHPDIREDTLRFTSHHTSTLDLRRSGIAVHLRELELGLCADTLGEGCVADEVAERLSVFRKTEIKLVFLCRDGAKAQGQNEGCRRVAAYR
jgi:hypothetical protein